MSEQEEYTGPSESTKRLMLEPNEQLIDVDRIRERLNSAVLLIAKFGTDGERTVAYQSMDDVRALLEEIEQLRGALGYPMPGNVNLRDDIVNGLAAALEGQIQQTREELSAKDKVLEWYGNAENYTLQFYYGEDANDPDELEEPIMADDGEQARSILSQYEVKT